MNTQTTETVEPAYTLSSIFLFWPLWYKAKTRSLNVVRVLSGVFFTRPLSPPLARRFICVRLQLGHYL